MQHLLEYGSLNRVMCWTTYFIMAVKCGYFFPNVASHMKELSIKEDVNGNADRHQTVRWHFECSFKEFNYNNLLSKVYLERRIVGALDKKK